MTSESEHAAEFYDQVWKSYGHLDAASPAAFHRRRLIVELSLRAKPDARTVLDAGCGQGQLLGQLARAFPRASLAGADVSEQSLTDTRKKWPSAELFLLDLVRPNFEEEHRSHLAKYDLIVCSEVLEHIPDTVLAAKNLRSLLSPRGAVVVTVPGGKMSRFDELIGHQRHFSPRELRRVLEAAGYGVTQAFGWGFPFHNLYRTAVRVASRATMREPSGEASQNRGGLTRVLSGAYGLFGRGLIPLYYLNLSRWGEQTLAVARQS
ncbi:MAG: methyltransferase domain-containing protein [Polyangiaceae bacterium]